MNIEEKNNQLNNQADQIQDRVNYQLPFKPGYFFLVILILFISLVGIIFINQNNNLKKQLCSTESMQLCHLLPFCQVEHYSSCLECLDYKLRCRVKIASPTIAITPTQIFPTQNIIPTQKDDMYKCQQDSDCVMGRADCSCCDCPHAINKAYVRKAACPPCEVLCDVYCPYIGNDDVKCVDGKCTEIIPTPTIKTLAPPKIDYSCQTDSDCVIKNVGNCCGYYPKCVNQSSKPNPEYVKQQCLEKGLSSTCGFETINSCQCKNNLCLEKQ